MLLVFYGKINAVCNVNVDESCTFWCYNPICFITAGISDDANNSSVKAAHRMVDSHDECTFNRGVELLSSLNLAVIQLISEALFIAVRVDRMSHLNTNIFTQHVPNSSTVCRMRTDLPQTQQNTLFFRPHSIYRTIIHIFR